MTGVRKADPAARRWAVVVVVVGSFVGALLILAFERYRVSLGDWVLAELGEAAARVGWVVLALAAALLAPMLSFAAYLWWLGRRVVDAQEFPPAGVRVIRDTVVLTGEKAISRGRVLKMLAVGCIAACVVLGLLLWRFASS